MYLVIQNFLIDAMFLLSAFLWWKSATAAPQSSQADVDALRKAYDKLDTAIELIYTCFDKRLLESDSPFNPHAAGTSLFNACAALCTAMAVFLQFIRDVLSVWTDDQGFIVAVMLLFLVLVFLFPFLKFFFSWMTQSHKKRPKTV